MGCWGMLGVAGMIIDSLASGSFPKIPYLLSTSKIEMDVSKLWSIGRVILKNRDIYYILVGVEPYPSEKWWSSSVRIIYSSQYMESHQIHVPNHQSV